MITIDAFNRLQQRRMKLAEKEYEVALKRIDELPPLVTDDTLYCLCTIN